MKGFAFHCHHGILFEWVTDYQARVYYIKNHKPEKERELRLKLFKMIPDDRIPSNLMKAREAYNKAEEAYFDKALKVPYKALKAYMKAMEAYGKALKAYTPEMIKLHKELCPDCPWDGESIF